MPEHRRVLHHFHQRLIAAVTRSALLKTRVSRTGRLLDCVRLERVRSGLSRRVLETVVRGTRSVLIELRFRSALVDEEDDLFRDSESERQDRWAEKTAREHKLLYDALDRRMRRYAELAKRETGVHSLWLGYPFLYLDTAEGDPRQWILAPVFLWPISIQVDHRHESRILIGRDSQAGPGKFNRAMAAWVSRQLNLKLDGPDEEELERLSEEDVQKYLGTLSSQFGHPRTVDFKAALEAIPGGRLLDRLHGPRFYNSAVLGVFRWQNEAILADIEDLETLDEIGGVTAAFVSGSQLTAPSEVPPPTEADRYQVYDADFSQQKVIWQSRYPPGLVVHGPPGTGKSQSIVNIIADALAHGRTVLMVCQKHAATRVVFERLKQVGLDGLCLEVTDNQKSRLPVFRSIRDQVGELPANANRERPEEREQLAAEIISVERELDEYADALHGRDPRIGASYREIKTIEGKTYAQFPTVRRLPGLQQTVAEIPAQQLRSIRREIEQTGRCFALADPLNNPWRYCHATVPDIPLPTLKTDVKKIARRLRHLDEQYVRKMEDFRQAVSHIQKCAPIPLDAVCQPSVGRQISDAESERVCESARAILSSRSKWWWFLSPRYWNARNEVCRYRAAWLSILQSKALRSADATDANVLQALSRDIQRRQSASRLLDELQSLGAFLTADGLAEPAGLVRGGQSIQSYLASLVAGLDQLESLFVLSRSREHREEPLNSILAELEEYEKRRNAGEHVPAPPEDLGANQYGHWWVALTEYTAALTWQDKCHRSHPQLKTITPEIHAAKVRTLKHLLEQKRELEAATIQAKWLGEQVSRRSAPWKRMFQLRRSKYGNAKRLREAIELSLPEGLLAMRPCWLVNPATAAEIFPLEAGLFDLVIFDEASQCPVEQAVPAIYRGKAVVVSGDEKQLPPTSFFSSAWSDDDPDDEEDVEVTDQAVTREEQLQRLGVEHLLEVEDLLAAAIGTLPECYLSVHYRSQHPELIEFSNHAFYGGRLEAPPAKTCLSNSHPPIRYCEIGGVYDRRTNREEARQVVKLLREFWDSEDECPTIGVVTFNQPQRDLIEDLLQQECLHNERFRVKYQQEISRQEDNQDVGFFVKNLENVQGDERDVMVFSTTFGRDTAGRFYRRFGPVGAVGGERRLNVAVTRAKQQVIVVGSMPIEEISAALSMESLPGSQLTPACYLQLYLAYARAISKADQAAKAHILNRLGRRSSMAATGSPESPFEGDVLNVVKGLGYEVDCQVGDSGFRIDLGVLARSPDHGYLLGIECDGATYHSDRSARLRDVWREQVLRGRGWRLHRIWSTTWWYHRAEETEKLKAVLQEAIIGLSPEICSPREAATQSEPSERRESWQMTREEWKKRRDQLREQGDEEALRAMGGLGTDHAHKYRVEQALKQGIHVPSEVLNDYPDLASGVSSGGVDSDCQDC